MEGVAPDAGGEENGASLRRPLARLLSRLAAVYGADRLASDPLSLVRRYPEARDREIAGIVVSGLAFGGVKQILRSGEAALDPLGSHPARSLRSPGIARALTGFKHRWIGGADLVLLYRTLAAALTGRTSLESCFLDGLDEDAPDLRLAMARFTRRLRDLAAEEGRPTRGLAYLLPDASKGSAVKRLCLFLRWMVRPDDGVDLGVWSRIPPSLLTIPLDTHVLRIARYVGLTARKTASWTTAREITVALSELCPEDPTRYDFALAQLGISRGCLHRKDPLRCRACPLDPVCTLSRAATPRSPSSDDRRARRR